MKQLNDKVAIVTGGNKGIGKAISFCLAAEGANVAIFARDKKAADEVVKVINEKGSRSIFVKTDITKLNEVEKSVDEVQLERRGSLPCERDHIKYVCHCFS